MKTYDLAVIGAGSGGLVAATTAKRSGLSTALIEKNKIGGECTHYGCVPSKALINCAKLFEAVKHTTKYGLPLVNIRAQLEFSKVMEHVDSIVQDIYQYETPEVFEKQGIDVFINEEGAKLIDNKTIKIGLDIVSAKNTLICTGSSPRKIEIKGADKIDFLDNENFWDLRSLPKSIVFVGGGVISAEIGQVLSRFGCKVTILEHNKRILKVLDDEVAEIIIDKFKEDRINIEEGCEIQEFDKRGNNAVVILRKDSKIKVIEAEAIFAASGRAPNVIGLELEKAGIDYSERGIKTNEYLQTSSENIYACGDVTTPFKFTHTSSYQAYICIENILNGNTKKNDLSALPWAIFTEPEIAHVGLSENQAREKHKNVKTFKVDATIDRYMTDSKTIGFLKVVFDKDDNIIGADAIGEHSGEWIQLITLAIKNKISVESFADTIFAYPTYSEIVKKAFTRFLRTRK